MTAKAKILGERLDTVHTNENTSEHLHRYTIASNFCKNKKVLDIACGEGYGSNLLSKVSSLTKGVDIDHETIEAAKLKYVSSNLEFKQGSADKIPFEDSMFDVVISFETLEHHDKHVEMLSEIKRVLVDGGLCIISTPDKRIYSDQKNYQNPFHVKELYKEEFRSLISQFFGHSFFFRQQFYAGSLITPDEGNVNEMDFIEGDFQGSTTISELQSEYLIGFMSDNPISVPRSSFFIDKNFADNKIKQFQLSSLRYKVGKLMLTPFRIFKKR